MTTRKLPQFVNPIDLCDKGTILEGELPLQAMNRLNDILANKEGNVLIKLDFHKNEQKVRVITGAIAGHLSLLCQRCMNPMGYPLDLSPHLCPVFESSAQRVLAGYEPLIVTEEPIKLTDIVEEEILLTLPIVPKHEIDKCPVDLSAGNL